MPMRLETLKCVNDRCEVHKMTYHQPGMLGCVIEKPANKLKREYR